ncbi:MAG: UbiA family prenyltransferase [Methylotenera sp.]|nr:UbiA family prenyltransferase [Oligoflexia bacterium]
MTEKTPTPALSFSGANSGPLLSRWKTYLMERSPPAPLLFICAGVSLAPMALLQEVNWGMLATGVAGTFGLLVQMRLGDELKDHEKDKIVHPERPLPRGLLSLKEVHTGMSLLMGSLMALAALSAALYSPLGGSLLALSVIYVWLMYKEFFIGKSLSREPMLYAWSHQLIVFPLYGWIGGLYGPEVFCNPEFVCWMIYNFGASMTFEICRKLDPKSHKLQETYLHHYGPGLVSVIIAFFVFVSIFAGIRAEHQNYLLPVQLPLLLSLVLIKVKPEKFKVIEGLAILSATIHIWMPTLRWIKFHFTGVTQ